MCAVCGNYFFTQSSVVFVHWLMCVWGGLQVRPVCYTFLSGDCPCVVVGLGDYLTPVTSGPSHSHTTSSADSLTTNLIVLIGFLSLDNTGGASHH